MPARRTGKGRLPRQIPGRAVDRVPTIGGRIEGGQDAAYYQWAHHEMPCRGCTLTVVAKPGVRRPDTPERLLVDHVIVPTTGAALDLNCGTGVVGASLALRAPALSVTLADRSLVHVNAAQRVLQANAIAGSTVHFGNGTSGLPADYRCDVVTIRMPKGRVGVLQLLRDAFGALRIGGQCYIAGPNEEGIRWAQSRMEELFGNADTLGYGGGSRVVLGVKADESPRRASAFESELLEHDAFHEHRIHVRGLDVAVKTRPGVFAYEHLDEGSRCLIEHMQLAGAGRVLDLGCGSGVVGVVAAMLAPDSHVHLADADCEAIRSTQKTIEANALGNCAVRASDCGEQLRGLSFDVVVTNPPFHLSHDADLCMAHQFILDSASLLLPSGRLLLVANRTLPYEDVIGRVFGRTQTVYKDSRFKVLLAERPLVHRADT